MAQNANLPPVNSVVFALSRLVLPSLVTFLNILLNSRWVWFVRIDVVKLDRLADFAGAYRAFIGQGLERRNCYVIAIDLKEPAQFLACVGTTETVRAQHLVMLGQEAANLVGERAHVIGRGDHRPAATGQALFDIADARLRFRMQHVPALAIQPLATQFGKAGHAP